MSIQRGNKFWGYLCLTLIIVSLLFSSLQKNFDGNLIEEELISSTKYHYEPNSHVEIQNPIIIDEQDPNKNWSDCIYVTGEGTFNNPFLLENLQVNDSSSQPGIKILNSYHYFIIQNCTINNSLYGILSMTFTKLMRLSKAQCRLMDLR